MKLLKVLLCVVFVAAMSVSCKQQTEEPTAPADTEETTTEEAGGDEAGTMEEGSGDME